MSASVLGKRTRNAAGTKLNPRETASTPQLTHRTVDSDSTRSKRRIILSNPNDENQNPFARNDYDEINDDGREVEAGSKPLRTTPRVVPAKHAISEQQASIAPSKASSQHRAIKSDIQVFEDAKNNGNGIPTPKTPRHRDALSKKVPITPRHKILLNGNQTTPRTPKTPSNGSTAVYHQARQLFSRCSNPGKLVKRDEERAELSSFINTCLESKSAGCIYVSGPPGTGKSALVQEVIKQYENCETLKMSTVNCMSVRNAKDLSEKMSEDLGLKENYGFEYLRSCFIRRKGKDCQKYLVVLDEVDQLVDLDLELLYSLFEWSMQPSSRLILIGIANALDLTDRFLPRLKNRSLKPGLLPFMPYTAAQIGEILTAKLQTLSPDEPQIVAFLQPAAIQFCAKKVASQTGDLRKAFDICRRAIDLVELETREKDANISLQLSPSKTPLMENINLSSPPTPRSPNKSPTTTYTLHTAPKATIAHVAKVTAQVFGNGTTQRLNSLNLQQNAVLCALSALEKHKRDVRNEAAIFTTPSKRHSSAPSIKQLFGVYSQLCKRENLLHPLTAIEFRDVVSGLETLGLITGADGKNGSFAVPMTPSKTPSRSGKGGFGTAALIDEKRVASVVGQNELSSLLKGPGGELLKEILNGDSVI